MAGSKFIVAAVLVVLVLGAAECHKGQKRTAGMNIAERAAKMRKEMLENMRAWNPLYEDDDDSSEDNDAAEASDEGFWKIPDMDLSGGFDWSKMKDSFATHGNGASASSFSSGGKGKSTSCVTVNGKTKCETSTYDEKDGEGTGKTSAFSSSVVVDGKGRGESCVTVNGKTKCETYSTTEEEQTEAVGKNVNAEKAAATTS